MLLTLFSIWHRYSVNCKIHAEEMSPRQVTSAAEFNQNELEDSLKAYCNSFNATTDKLLTDDERSDVKYCEMEFLRKEMKRLRLWGAMFAIDFIIERYILSIKE